MLLPSHYMADMHGYAWLIGPGKALDPDELFLVASELFGNGRSSSPSNTPEPVSRPAVSADAPSAITSRPCTICLRMSCTCVICAP